MNSINNDYNGEEYGINMKNCKCTENCGCSLSDNLTVGACNISPYNNGWMPIGQPVPMPTPFYTPNEIMTLKPLSLYSNDELLDELGKRTNTFVKEITYDENSQVYMFVIKK